MMSDKPKPTVTPFPQALMRERARYQISRRDIARHVGVGEGVIQKWERGESIPSTVQFKRLVTRLPRVAPNAPDWATHAEQVLDGSADQYRREAAELAEQYKGVMDAAHKPEPQEFGAGLLRIREENEVTQEQLGEILGVEQATISGWECERITPVKENLLKLLEVLPELKAGMETGAIRRPQSRDIPKPVGPEGMRFPRASTIDAALDMVLAQSDEEAARPRQPRLGWAPQDFPAEHEHKYDDADYAGADGRTRVVVCSICGEPWPDSKSRQEIRTVKPEHAVIARRCPCRGEVVPLSGSVAPWVCLKCRRELFSSELIDGQPAQAVVKTTAAELAEAYVRARLALLQAKRDELAAQEALTNASTDRRNAEQEVKDAEALLELAISEESKA